MKTKSKKGGFTLIEILLVAAGIAILFVVLSVSYKNVIPHISRQTSDVMVERLNNSANEWVSLKIQTGEFGAKLADLGSNLESAVESLKTPINLSGQEVRVGLGSVSAEKVKKMGIFCENGVFRKGA